MPLSVADFDDLLTSEYALSAQPVREHLEHILKSDHDSTPADARVRQYYAQGGRLLWVGRDGVNPQADTLMAYLSGHLPPAGLAPEAFCLPQLAGLRAAYDRLDFAPDRNAAQVLAQLEYSLTKAYLRYVRGQRYGFANPYTLFNKLDVRQTDDQGRPVVYNRLFDIDVEQPPHSYYQQLLQKVAADSVGPCLREAEPRDAVYSQLVAQLAQTADATARQRLLANMERRRWRTQQPDAQSKHVFVNVAAQHLWAVSPDSVQSMRVVCGAVKTKTPLLTSSVNLIQVNPIWIIPSSIVQNEVSPHAGDSAWFARHHYYITRKGSGEQVAPRSLSVSELAAGGYRVSQEGGPGNSLGRIVFRFPNQFSVYLHDTSNPGAFGYASRALSHGCVRVQRPFDLAQFMIDDPDEWLLDRLRISMDLPPETDRGRDYLKEHPDERGKHRLVSSVGVSPRVPVFIAYYTVYPNPATGQLQTWPDPYGYDRLIQQAIKPFVQ